MLPQRTSPQSGCHAPNPRVADSPASAWPKRRSTPTAAGLGKLGHTGSPITYPEFKEEAARLVVDTSRPIADVARELGISETSLGNWVRAWREKHAEEEPPLQVSERARLRELERLNRELEMELVFLKKAAAYFAREHR